MSSRLNVVNIVVISAKRNKKKNLNEILKDRMANKFQK